LITLLKRRERKKGGQTNQVTGQVIERDACSRFWNGNQGDGGANLVPKARPGTSGSVEASKDKGACKLSSQS